MNPPSQYEVSEGLYHFRVILQARVEEELPEYFEDGEPQGKVRGYYQTYGVTAARFTEAVGLLEHTLRSKPPAGGPDDPFGSIKMVECTAIDPKGVELETEDWKTQVGIHFVSGKIFYEAAETPGDNDLLGEDRIEEHILELDEDDA